MSKLILALFPQGQRKTMVSMIALVVGVIIERFGGGLSDNMTHALIALVAIFTGGNVLEHLSGVLKPLKGTKVGQIVEDIIPGDQGLGVVAAEPKAEMASAPEAGGTRMPHPMEEEFMGFTHHVEGRINTLQQQIQVQAQGLAQLVQIINTQRGASQGPKTGGGQ
jgi:hypothetical protein